MHLPAFGRSVVVLAIGISALVSLALFAAPQTTPPPGAAPDLGAPRFEDTVAVNQILVPVLVRTRSGFANSLKAKDFRLSVDDRPVPIQSFDERTEAPTSLVFLQDLSGSMGTGSKLEMSR